MKARKVIAREGLILLGFALLGLIIYFTGKHLNDAYLRGHTAYKYKVIGEMQYRLSGYAPYLKLKSLGLLIAGLGYPVCALIRFLAWSIKTLRGE